MPTNALRDQILSFLSHNQLSPMTAKTIADALGVSTKHVTAELYRMYSRDLVDRERMDVESRNKGDARRVFHYFIPKCSVGSFSVMSVEEGEDVERVLSSSVRYGKVFKGFAVAVLLLMLATIVASVFVMVDLV